MKMKMLPTNIINRLFGQSEKQRLSAKLDLTAPRDRVKMEMQQLSEAVGEALYRPCPARSRLLEIYKKTMTDSHLYSQVEIATGKIIGEQFVVKKDNTVSDQKTELFKKQWFEDFLKFCWLNYLYGYSLIEFGTIDASGVSECRIFPRRYVEPFSGQILLNPADSSGIPFRRRSAEYYLLELGRPDDLGLLQLLSREVIWKNFSRTDWSQCSEKFGMPLVWLKTACDDPVELERIEKMLAAFASNGYILTDIEDEIQIVESGKSDIYKIYEMNARFCDEQISKCINGQTGTSDEKAYTGSAEVHERILDDLHLARLRTIGNIVNDKLFPFLAFHGFDIAGCRFVFTALDREETPKLPRPGPPALSADLLKKKAPMFPDWVINMPTGQ